MSFVSGSNIDVLSTISYGIIPHYFSRRKTVASAIMTSGGSLSQMVMPKVFTSLQEEYGYRGATLITGALILHCCPAAMVLHPVEWHRNTRCIQNSITTQKKLPTVDKKLSSAIKVLKRLLKASISNLRLLKSLRSVVFVVTISLAHVLFYNVHALMPLIMNEQGFSWQESSLCMTVSGGCNLICKLLTAFLSCRPNTRVRPTFLLGVCIAGAGTVGELHVFVLTATEYSFKCYVTSSS